MLVNDYDDDFAKLIENLIKLVNKHNKIVT